MTSESAEFHTRLEIGMTCEGCAAAVTRLLKKINGVTTIDARVDEKVVVVTSNQYIEPEIYVKQLESWSKASGKYVKLS